MMDLYPRYDRGPAMASRRDEATYRGSRHDEDPKFLPSGGPGHIPHSQYPPEHPAVQNPQYPYTRQGVGQPAVDLVGFNPMALPQPQAGATSMSLQPLYQGASPLQPSERAILVQLLHERQEELKKKADAEKQRKKQEEERQCVKFITEQCERQFTAAAEKLISTVKEVFPPREDTRSDDYLAEPLARLRNETTEGDKLPDISELQNQSDMTDIIDNSGHIPAFDQADHGKAFLTADFSNVADVRCKVRSLLGINNKYRKAADIATAASNKVILSDEVLQRTTIFYVEISTDTYHAS